MIIGVPRVVIVCIAVLFSLYHVILGLLTLEVPANPIPVVAAMVLYLTATVVSLVGSGNRRMPLWMGAFNVAVCIALPLMITPELDPTRIGGNGYATWYVAAVGTLMTITSTRRRQALAWTGIAFLVAQTTIWAGPAALVQYGVVGSVSWVIISHVLSRSIAKAAKDARRFAYAEREAADWQAAQEAHVFERQFRLGQTSSKALPMLRQIERSGGVLAAAERQECLLLEGAIRDEIRGRNLLNDAVREQVMLARRRGAAVTLLDEGGMDSLPEPMRQRVLDRLAEALRHSAADKIIVRTAASSSDIAVTVVGLIGSGKDDDATALGQDSGDDEEGDEIELWLEIPRAD
ncbi:MAG: hypothetical protein JWM51_1636 [Microbacteriaceae bacterium]|nr:hypothetical protein [Microbacteriaceae bacterium]